MGERIRYDYWVDSRQAYLQSLQAPPEPVPTPMTPVRVFLSWILCLVVAYLLLWAFAPLEASAAGLEITCVSTGDAPMVGAELLRDPDPSNPQAYDWIVCRPDRTGIDCPCKTRLPKPSACFLVILAPPDPSDPTYIACGYTDRAHPVHPTIGPWHKVKP